MLHVLLLHELLRWLLHELLRWLLHELLLHGEVLVRRRRHHGGTATAPS